MEVEEQKRQQELTSYKHNEMLYRFAGQAMQGYCTLGASVAESEFKIMAELAVTQAKALIEALKDEVE